MAKFGPKPKYDDWRTEDGLLLLTAWSRDGASYKDIADRIGIAETTLYTWKSRFEDINKALSRGREPTDIEVENALYKRALGYTEKILKNYKIRKVYYEDGKKCEVEELVQAYEDLHVPGDVIAQKYWLSNRKPEIWKDRPAEREIDGAPIIIINGISDETD